MSLLFTPSKPVDNIDDYIQRVYNEARVLSAGLPDYLIEEKASMWIIEGLERSKHLIFTRR